MNKDNNREEERKRKHRRNTTPTTRKTSHMTGQKEGIRKDNNYGIYYRRYLWWRKIVLKLHNEAEVHKKMNKLKLEMVIIQFLLHTDLGWTGCWPHLLLESIGWRKASYSYWLTENQNILAWNISMQDTYNSDILHGDIPGENILTQAETQFYKLHRFCVAKRLWFHWGIWKWDGATWFTSTRSTYSPFQFCIGDELFVQMADRETGSLLPSIRIFIRQIISKTIRPIVVKFDMTIW